MKVKKMQIVKLALLIVILAEDIKRARKKLFIECDICEVKVFYRKILRDDNYKICGYCAQVMGEIAES